jgi:two-component system chemotaxis response regulator CheB
VTLDVEMPKMNGLDFLDKIMRLRPTPVIMVSNLTARGADASVRALEIGAFDCVLKPTNDLSAFDELPEKVKAAAATRGRLQPRTDRDGSSAGREGPRPQYVTDGRLLAIGSSTGGVEALITVLGALPENCPPTAIVQHMPPSFTKSFAERLDRLCAPRVMEAYDGAVMAQGQVYLAPGGIHLELTGRPGSLRCRLRDKPPVNGHKPSVDVLFSSVVQCVGGDAVGVILTGMGRDGAEGLMQMRKAGARTLGQDEATSLVYGMPKAAFEIGAVEKQVSLHKMGQEILARSSAS